MLTKEYIQSKQDDSNKKMEILKNLINKNRDVNNSYVNYCKCKYLTQLYRKFRFRNINNIQTDKIDLELDIGNEDEYLMIVDDEILDQYLERIKDEENVKILKGKKLTKYQKEMEIKKEKDKIYWENHNDEFDSLFFVLKYNLVVSKITIKNNNMFRN